MQKCDHTKYKIIQSHGNNSRGIPVCKICGKLIKEEMRQKRKDIANKKQRIRRSLYG